MLCHNFFFKSHVFFSLGDSLPAEGTTLKGPYTSLICRSLRIGSYKMAPSEKVIFVSEGIRIKVPSISEGKDI